MLQCHILRPLVCRVIGMKLDWVFSPLHFPSPFMGPVPYIINPYTRAKRLEGCIHCAMENSACSLFCGQLAYLTFTWIYCYCKNETVFLNKNKTTCFLITPLSFSTPSCFPERKNLDPPPLSFSPPSYFPSGKKKPSPPCMCETVVLTCISPLFSLLHTAPLYISEEKNLTLASCAHARACARTTLTLSPDFSVLNFLKPVSLCWPI